MSIDSKHLIKIIAVNSLDFVSKKTGMPGTMKLAQCIVCSENEQKGEQILVGELVLPQHLSETQPGEYVADFELSVDLSKRIGTKLVGLHPVAQPIARAASSKESNVKAQ